ncbi:MAG: SRPBCC domain-containing protein, partial [Myxococcales bacterium]|nr:SRPBCC domain-containing protein [Myxococcales bacterium]
METEEIQLSTVVLASPNQVYSAWLDERQHTAFTGARATVEPWVGGRYTAWDGYATALIVGLDTGKTILLTWRTADFAPDFPDSHVEFHLESIAGGTRVTIKQRGIPKGHAAQYKDAWKKHYLDSMKKLFAKPEALRNALRE